MSDLSNELKSIATNAQNNASKVTAAGIVVLLLAESRAAAKEGKFSLQVCLRQRNWSRAAAEIAAAELRNKGLNVIVNNEVVAWYSNTDCDREDFIKVSWQ